MTAGLWLMLWATALGQADAGVAGGGFRWDIPEVVSDVPISGPLVTDGLPMVARVVRTRAKAEPLIRKLAADFLRAGFWIPPRPAQPQNLPLPYLAALDARRLWSYSVFFRPNRDGTLTLILAVADLSRRGSGAPLAPVFPGAQALITSDVEGMKAMSYQARASPAEVRSFYRDVLGRGGFREAEPNRFVRGRETLAVEATGPPDGGVSQVLVVQGPMVIAPELSGQAAGQ